MMKIVLRCLLPLTAFASPLVTRVTIGPATIQLEEATFAGVAKQLGDAPIVQTGDAGGSRRQACYQTAGPNPARYYLESGEMGEEIRRVDAVSPGAMSASEDTVIATHCRTLHAGVSALRTDRGIGLGQSHAEVERRLHLTGRDSAGVFLYARSEDHGKGTRAYNVYSWLRVRYVRGRVAAFSTGLVSSW